MLNIKNIELKFDNHMILKADFFSARKGAITCITGESGSGKTSLLYTIGLLAYYKPCQYSYDDKAVQLDHESDVENFRYNHISYVLQDHNVIDSITVEKNIEFMLTMNAVSNLSVDAILEKVVLQDKKNAYPSSLSGGEKQRLAFACAIAKNTDIILGDEITSSLDYDSKAIILRLLKEMAYDNKTVIIVSHDEEIIANSDCVYVIEDCKLKLLHDKDKKETISQTTQKRINTNFLERYQVLFLSNKKLIIRKVFNILLTSILVLASLAIMGNAKETNEGLIQTTESISNLELFLMNQYDFQIENEDTKAVISNMDGNGQPAFDDEVSAKIETLDHIAASYEIYNFSSAGLNIISGKMENGEMKVIRNGTEVKRRMFNDEELRNGYSYDYTIKPYFKEQTWFHEGDDGIYINQEFAHTYSVEKNDVLHFQAFVPTAILHTEATYYPNQNCENLGGAVKCTPAEEGKIDYQSSVYAYVPIELDYRVLDIINSVNTSGGYTLQNTMYLPYDSMMEIIHNNKVTQFDQYEEMGIWNGSFSELKSPIRILFADKYQSIPEIQNNIKSLSDHIAIGYDYQDLDALYAHLNQETSLSLWYSIGLIFLVIIFITFSGYQQIKNYRTQILMMQINGLSKKNILLYFLCNSCMQVIYCTLCIMAVYQVVALPFLFMDPMHLPDWYLLLYSYINFSPVYLLYGTLILIVGACCTMLCYKSGLKHTSIALLLRGNHDSN